MIYPTINSSRLISRSRVCDKLIIIQLVKFFSETLRFIAVAIRPHNGPFPRPAESSTNSLSFRFISVSCLGLPTCLLYHFCLEFNQTFYLFKFKHLFLPLLFINILLHFILLLLQAFPHILCLSTLFLLLLPPYDEKLWAFSMIIAVWPPHFQRLQAK